MALLLLLVLLPYLCIFLSEVGLTFLQSHFLACEEHALTGVEAEARLQQAQLPRSAQQKVLKATWGEPGGGKKERK